MTAKSDPNRVTKPTKVTEERSKPPTDEDKRRSKEAVEEAKRKLDSQWGTQLGQTKGKFTKINSKLNPCSRRSSNKIQR